MRRIEEFPDTINPSHPLHAKMERIAKEYGLERTPAGLYAAAKIAASEMRKPVANSDRSKTEEAERIAAIKKNKTSSDRAASGSGSAVRLSYDELLRKGASRGVDDETFKQLLKAKAGGKGLNIPSSGL